MIGGNTADVVDIAITHSLQEADCLSAPHPGVAVHIQGCIFIFGDFLYVVKLLQGNILAAGDMPFPLLLGSANIQKDGTRCVLVLLHALVNIGLLPKIKNTHSLRLLCVLTRKPFHRASC